MSQLTINERIKFLIENSGLSVRAFSTAIGATDTNTRNYIDRGSKPNSEFLEKLLRRFDNTNPTWLLLGEGEPFLSTDPRTPSTNLDAKKISRSQVQLVGANKGSMSIAAADLEKDLATARKEIALLTSQLADKERTIQILMKQLS